MAFAPVLSVFLDDVPMPRVEVFFPAFAVGTAVVDVYRLTEGRQYKVRSAVGAVTAGELSRVDFEVPFGVPVTYRAEMFDALGMPLGFTDTASVEVDCLDMWVHNPLNPAGGVRVQFRGNALRDLSRPVDATVFYPEGAHVARVVSGQRRGLQGVVLDVIVDTVEDADRFAALVGDYSTSTTPILCFRVGANDRVRLPRPFFAAVPDPREVDVTYALGGEKVAYAMVGTEATPPSPGLVVPLFTNADLNAFYASNAALNADNLTNGAVNRRYDLGGTA